jgi:hypothetical protein
MPFDEKKRSRASVTGSYWQGVVVVMNAAIKENSRS